VPEEENIDRWLRQAMSEKPLPTLSSGFDNRLMKQIRPRRRLSSTGWVVLVGYTLIAVALSIWTMRIESIGWSTIAAACLAPVVMMAAIYRRHVRLA
jgi:hypothetical protein